MRTSLPRRVLQGRADEKRLLAVLTIAILGLALGLAACGGGDDNGSDLLASIEDEGRSAARVHRPCVSAAVRA